MGLSAAITSTAIFHTPICSFPSKAAPFPPNSSAATRTMSSLPLVTPTWKTEPYRSGRCKRSHTQVFFGVRMSAVELEPSLIVKRKAAEVSEALRGTSIFLVGINGSMKTSTGSILAGALRYCYFDSDGLVVQAAGGISDARSLLQKDEQGFHASETEVLKQLSSMVRLVVCAGDGAVQSSTNLAYLRYGISIWIDVPLDILAEEMYRKGDEYPMLKATPPVDSYHEMLDMLSKRYTEAKGGYATADATISLQDVASKLGRELKNVMPEDVALEVLKQIEKLIRIKKMMEDAARSF